MKIRDLPLDGLKLIELDIYQDKRGSFRETWRKEIFRRIGIAEDFVQDNFSISNQGVLRGLHFQRRFPQGKIISVLQGSIFDVAIDLRPESEKFGDWYSCELDAAKGHQLWLPAGFAHGFYSLEANTIVAYKCTEYYHPEDQETLIWSDGDLNINWPFKADPILSEKDKKGKTLREVRRVLLSGSRE